MASSSSTTFITPIQQTYDVFISFKGIDTRHNITNHLYTALCGEKIKTFIDNDLMRGDDISDALLQQTIADSKISIIIFSENYCYSRWCLDELVKIMECNKENGQIVIPVFFKVNPSHVRKQSGPFGQALAQYEGHPKIQTWRDALTKAANLSGWDSQVTRPEAMLVESIVADILDKLYYTSSSNSGNLVGMTAPRMRLNTNIHARFLNAVELLGGHERATPESVLELMDVRDLTLAQARSHLQMYRSLKATGRPSGGSRGGEEDIYIPSIGNNTNAEHRTFTVQRGPSFHEQQRFGQETEVFVKT